MKWQILLQQVGEEWDDRSQLKEQIEAKLLHRQEAALRRERALAYSFSHQVARLPHLCFIFVSVLVLVDQRVTSPELRLAKMNPFSHSILT